MARMEVFKQVVATREIAREAHLAMFNALQGAGNVEILALIENRPPHTEVLPDSHRIHDVWSYLQDHCEDQKIHLTIFKESN